MELKIKTVNTTTDSDGSQYTVNSLLNLYQKVLVTQLVTL